MAQIIFEVGDLFTTASKKGTGLVIGENRALMILGEGGRTGYKREKGEIPADAVPAPAQGGLRAEVRMALETAAELLPPKQGFETPTGS